MWILWGPKPTRTHSPKRKWPTNWKYWLQWFKPQAKPIQFQVPRKGSGRWTLCTRWWFRPKCERIGTHSTCVSCHDTFCLSNYSPLHPQFIRVNNDTCPAVLYDFFTKHWKLGKPNLLISVTGGITDIEMKPTLKEVFKRGLIKTAQNPGVFHKPVTCRGNVNQS